MAISHDSWYPSYYGYKVFSDHNILNKVIVSSVDECDKKYLYSQKDIIAQATNGVQVQLESSIQPKKDTKKLKDLIAYYYKR